VAVSQPAARPIDAVIKLGGDVLEGEALADVAADIARARAGRRLLIVHGGGPQVTALARRLGIEANIVGGRRITDDPMLDIVKMVVAGRLNSNLVAALRADGVPAFGVSGASGVIRAHRRPPRVVSGAGDLPIDFGLVGDIDGFDVEDARRARRARRAAGDRLPGRGHERHGPQHQRRRRGQPARGRVRAGALVACTAVRGRPPGQGRPGDAPVAADRGRGQSGHRRRHRAGRDDPQARGGVRAARRRRGRRPHRRARRDRRRSLVAPGSVGTLLVP
jgi:hypothetical protein